MIRDKLNKLIEKKLDPQVNRSLENIKSYDDDQLFSVLSTTGIRLKDDIIIKYYTESIGFQCYNENERITGKTPLCQNIERFLNR